MIWVFAIENRNLSGSTLPPKIVVLFSSSGDMNKNSAIYLFLSIYFLI